MITIIHLLNTNSFSGAENVAINIIKNMNNIYNYNCIYIALKGPIEKKLVENDIPYYLVEKIDKKTLELIDRKFQPSIYHCHDFTTSVLCALSFKNKKIISHLHNNPSWIKKRNIKSIIYGMCINKYQYVLAVSNSIFKEYIYANKIKKKEVISNPIKKIDTNKISKIDEYCDILFLGRLTKQKDPIRFIKIIHKLKHDKKDITAFMIGDGELREECLEEIHKLKCEENIKLLGFKENRFDYINNSKILCVPSLWEGFGLVAIEALSFGKPVVCSGVGGLIDIVNSDCGAICKSDEEYCDEILKLLTDQDYYNSKKEKSYNRIKNIENYSSYYKKLDYIYREIL